MEYGLESVLIQGWDWASHRHLLIGSEASALCSTAFMSIRSWEVISQNMYQPLCHGAWDCSAICLHVVAIKAISVVQCVPLSTWKCRVNCLKKIIPLQTFLDESGNSSGLICSSLISLLPSLHSSLPLTPSPSLPLFSLPSSLSPLR